MVREEVAGSTQTLQWKCVESRVDSKRLYYGRFILSPLRKGQAEEPVSHVQNLGACRTNILQ